MLTQSLIYCKYLDNKIAYLANSINYITLKSDCISGITKDYFTEKSYHLSLFPSPKGKTKQNNLSLTRPHKSLDMIHQQLEKFCGYLP